MRAFSFRQIGFALLCILISSTMLLLFSPVSGQSGTISGIAIKTKKNTPTKTKTRTPTKTTTRAPTKSPTRVRTLTKSATAIPATLTRTPTSTPTSTAASTPTLTPSATPNPDAALNTIVNGGFETTGGWQATHPSFAFSTGSGGVLPNSGSYMMMTTGREFEIYQSVIVPQSAPILRFSYRVTGSSASCVGSQSYMYISIDRWYPESYWYGCDTAGWETFTFDLSSEAGNSRELVIYIGTNGTTVFLDNIGFVSAPTRLVDYY